MSRSAQVRSLEILRRVAAALETFGEEAADAVAGSSRQVRRQVDWLAHDQLAYWKSEVRSAHEQVAECRTALERCRMNRVGDHEPTCEQERKELATAKRRLETAERKVEAVRHWTRVLDKEVIEYEGRVGPLSRWLDAELPRARARLERMAASLESYSGTGSGKSPPAADEEP